MLSVSSVPINEALCLFSSAFGDISCNRPEADEKSRDRDVGRTWVSDDALRLGFSGRVHPSAQLKDRVPGKTASDESAGRKLPPEPDISRLSQGTLHNEFVSFFMFKNCFV